MKFSETVNEVIRLAEATRDYWDRELPKRHPDYPFVHPGEDDGPPPPEQQQLKELLERLPEEDVYRLFLLAQVGRWRVRTDDLAGSYKTLQKTQTDLKWLVARMGENLSLGDQLTDGPEELRKSHLEVDSMLTAGSAA